MTMPEPKRSPVEESARLHRARRADELRVRDTALCTADTGLSQAQLVLARAMFAVARGRPEASSLVAEAALEIKRARHLLRAYFDHQGDEHGS
ncbi:MAG: hypothetical protein ACREVG_00690 [Burkholderiales bacterium]